MPIERKMKMYVAGFTGFSFGYANPWDLHSPEWNEWQEGFDDAKASEDAQYSLAVILTSNEEKVGVK